jgi:NADH dehydrogenase
MKKKILPKDYPELNFGQMRVHLVEATPRLLNGMNEASAKKVEEYLSSLGVEVLPGTSVKNYNGHAVLLSNGTTLYSRCLVWAAGVKGSSLDGLPAASVLPNKRILVDDFNRIEGLKDVFAIGDIASMKGAQYPKGHPQVAPVAMQQAVLLAKNLSRVQQEKGLKAFVYKDKGSMATVGRNLAVAELGKIKLKGFIAWIIWMMVHLMSIIGVKNRLFILINWTWQYITYDQSLRLIISPSETKAQLPAAKEPGATLHKQLAGMHS